MFLVRTDLDDAIKRWRDIILTSLPWDRLGGYVALRKHDLTIELHDLHEESDLLVFTTDGEALVDRFPGQWMTGSLGGSKQGEASAGSINHTVKPFQSEEGVSQARWNRSAPFMTSDFEAVRKNLFPACHGAIEDWHAFPWHRDRANRIQAHKAHSSQAIAIDVFGTLKMSTDRDRNSTPLPGVWE